MECRSVGDVDDKDERYFPTKTGGIYKISELDVTPKGFSNAITMFSAVF